MQIPLLDTQYIQQMAEEHETIRDRSHRLAGEMDQFLGESPAAVMAGAMSETQDG